MSSNKKKSGKTSIISIILIVVAMILMCYAIASYFVKDEPKDDGNPDDTTDVEENRSKAVEVTYDGYIYKLPTGWRLNEENSESMLKIFCMTSDDGNLVNMGAYITLQNISSTNKTKEELFKDATFFEASLKKRDSANIVGNPTITTINAVPLIIFPYEHANNGKLLLAYMPAYDDYFYDIQFYSNKVIDGKEERYYNENDLSVIAEMLNSRVKGTK